MSKIPVSLQSKKKTKGTFHGDQYSFSYISLISSWNEKCFGESCRDNRNTHFALGNLFFSYCAGDKIEKNEMDWACGAYG